MSTESNHNDAMMYPLPWRHIVYTTAWEQTEIHRVVADNGIEVFNGTKEQCEGLLRSVNASASEILGRLSLKFREKINAAYESEERMRKRMNHEVGELTKTIHILREELERLYDEKRETTKQ